jgi:hypothetical protein
VIKVEMSGVLMIIHPLYASAVQLGLLAVILQDRAIAHRLILDPALL